MPISATAPIERLDLRRERANKKQPKVSNATDC
jgi:hypothetical protein